MDAITIRKKLCGTEECFEAISDFTHAIIGSLALEVEDQALGGAIRRMAIEIQSCVDAIAEAENEVILALSGSPVSSPVAPEATCGAAVMEPLQQAKAYVGALNVMSCDEELDDRWAAPMWRLVCDVADRLDEVEKAYHRQHPPAELPEPDDDGKGEVEPAVAEA